MTQLLEPAPTNPLETPEAPRPAGPARRPTTWGGAFTGLLAAAAGMAAGELVAGITDRSSPVVAVGNTVIDHVPRPLKEFAVETFGTNDKKALVVGILAVVALYAALIGRFARKRLALGLAGAALFGAVGLWCATTGRTGESANAPSAVIVGVVAVVVLWYLTRAATGRRTGVDTGPAGDDSSAGDRRRFLVLSAGTAGAAAVAAIGGRRLVDGNVSKVARVRTALRLPMPKASRALPKVNPAATAPVPEMTPFVTPNADFYRIDTALIVPRVDVKTWKLKVTGMVDREVSLSYDDLLHRSDLVEHDCTIMCVSNSIGGGLIGNARWLGVPLATILNEAGVHKDATQLVGISVDGFTAGFRTALALDGRDALIAIGMNGEPLPVNHGFPARLIVPGIYGYVSATKWLEEIRLTRWEDFDGYWVPRGWSKEGPIKTGSRIDVPRRGKAVVAGRTPIAGVAWAQHRGIAKVEVQVDDGPWRTATLAADGGLDTWRQWSLPWDATPGRHVLRVRATDIDGKTQPEEVTDVAPDGATGWHTVGVNVKEA